MSLIDTDLARELHAARLVEVEGSRYARQAAAKAVLQRRAERLSRKAERASRRAERVASQARLAAARVI
jgi:hypothetical protein